VKRATSGSGSGLPLQVVTWRRGVLASMRPKCCSWPGGSAPNWQGRATAVVSDTISDTAGRQRHRRVASRSPAFAISIGTVLLVVFSGWARLAGAGKVPESGAVDARFRGLGGSHSFPYIPCQVSDTAWQRPRARLDSPGGNDRRGRPPRAAFLVLRVIPGPLWRRSAGATQWRRLKPVMVNSRRRLPGVLLGRVRGVRLPGQRREAGRMLSTTCVLWLAAVATYCDPRLRFLSCRADEKGTAMTDAGGNSPQTFERATDGCPASRPIFEGAGFTKGARHDPGMWKSTSLPSRSSVTSSSTSRRHRNSPHISNSAAPRAPSGHRRCSSSRDRRRSDRPIRRQPREVG